jgi:TonB-dependent SusC/RagA subfamily outer membrane receptor
MNWLTEYISEGIIHALGMTFLHSIWLGILAAFFVSVAFYVFKEKRADIRYNISRGTMMVFFLAVCATFTIYYEDTSNYTLPSINYEDRLSETEMLSSGVTTAETDLLDQIHNFLNLHAGTLVVFWLIGIVLLSIRFAGGFIYIRKLRTTGLGSVPAEWELKMEEWGAKLGIKKLPSFHTSLLVTSPIAFGYIKPMILFPLGMFTSMPVQHLDAMLMHELIHVKNADYITNLFLSVMEILLFFNPTVWWLSAVIRAEMEHRCDDMAVAMTGNKTNYAYALVAMQENKIFQKTELALGMAKSNSQLTQRVNRLFGSNDGKTISYGRPLISFVVLLASVLLLAFSSPEETIVAAEEGLDSTLIAMNSLSSVKIPDSLHKDEGPSPMSSLNVSEVMVLFADTKTVFVSEMNSSDDSLQNAYYYYNDKPVDKASFYEYSGNPGVISIGHVLGDSIEMMLYSKDHAGIRIGHPNRNKDSLEEILLVDGKERPMDFLDQPSSNANLASITVMTGKHAADISPKYADKTVIVVTTKKAMMDKSSDYNKRADSLRLVRYLRNENSKITEEHKKTEILITSKQKKSDLTETKKYKGYPYSPYLYSYGLSVDNFRDSIKQGRTVHYPRNANSISRMAIGPIPGTKDYFSSAFKYVPGIAGGPTKVVFSSSLTKDSQDSIPPLFLVDGVKVEDVSAIDPKEIASISVLKDESAIKKYGEEGINGVIEITTKQYRVKKHTKDTKLSVTHSILKSGEDFFLIGKVIGNVTKKNVTDAFIRFDDNWEETFHTDENGEFEVAIPSGANKAVVRHFMLPSVYISVDRQKIENEIFVSNLEKSLKVNPNPASGIVKIHIENNEDQWVFINIMSVDMKKTIKNIQRKRLKSGVHEFQWNSKKVSPGMYLVWVQTKKETFSKKLLIER